MKNLSILLWMGLVLCACSVVEEGQMDAENSAINFDGTYPNSAIDVNAYLLGGESRTWTTLEFTIDGVSGFQNCRLDDQIQLNSDKTYDYDGGDMLCGAEDNVKLKSGTWEVDVDNRMLTFDSGTDHEAIFHIESLNAEEIVVRSQYYSWEVLGKFTHE
ncbi:lipocalin family protein [Reichenbachiella sp.]|uniref:lipocalin family protein n=1 Tax=Reichenbachiella sp. TaxID=2184521 RepID=UPI003B5CF1A0